MGDYLSNLVGKSLNQTPVVQPRQASRFAPSPYTTGAVAPANFGASNLAGLLRPDDPADPATQRSWLVEGRTTEGLTPVRWAHPATVISLETGPLDTAPQPPGRDSAENAALEPTPSLSPSAQTSPPMQTPLALPKPIQRSHLARQHVPNAPEQTIRQPVTALAPSGELAAPNPLHLLTTENEPENSVPRQQSFSAERRAQRAWHDLVVAPVDQDQAITDNADVSASTLPPRPQQQEPAATEPKRVPFTQRSRAAAAQPSQPVGLDELTVLISTEQASHPASVVDKQAAQRQAVTPITQLTEVSGRHESQTIRALPRPQQPRVLPPSAANDARLTTIRITNPVPAAELSAVSTTNLAEPEQRPAQISTRRVHPQSDLGLDSVQHANQEHNGESPSRGSAQAKLAAQTTQPMQHNPGGPLLPQTVLQPVTTPPYTNLLKPELTARPEEPLGTPNVVPIRVVAQPRTQARPEGSRAPELLPPTIHVSIGRIEVRAIAPGPPARKPSTPSVMSLNDYLQTRNGGSR